jgi:predicted Fe-Mo cluster-binding NifX family protein
MKIAIPVESDIGALSKVAGINDCKSFLVFNVEGKSYEMLKPLKMDLPENVRNILGAYAFMLLGEGINAIIVDNISEKDRIIIAGTGIRVFIGPAKTVDDAINRYLNNGLTENSVLDPCEKHK